MAANCNFDTLQDSLIRDRIVCSIRNEGVRERLLQELNLTHEKCVKICRASELSKANMEAISGGAHAVDAIRKKPHKKESKQNKADNKSERMLKICKYCGQSHLRKKEKSPAYKKQCSKCKRMNHFASMCKAGVQSSKVHLLEEESGDDSPMVDYALGEINAGSDDEWFEEVKIQGQPVTFKLYSGAHWNVIPKTLHEQFKSPLKKSYARLVLYLSEHKVKPNGKTQLVVKYKRQCYLIEFQVVDSDVKPVLGLKASTRMNLIQRVQAVEDVEGKCRHFPRTWMPTRRTCNQSAARFRTCGTSSTTSSSFFEG